MKKWRSLLWSSALALPLLGGCTGVEIMGAGLIGYRVFDWMEEQNRPVRDQGGEISHPVRRQESKPFNPTVTRASYSPPAASVNPRPRYRDDPAESEPKSDVYPAFSEEGELAAAIQSYENGEYPQAAAAFRALEMNPLLRLEDQAKAGVYLAVSQLMNGQKNAACFTYRIVLARHPELRQASWMNAFTPEQLDELVQP